MDFLKEKNNSLIFMGHCGTIGEEMFPTKKLHMNIRDLLSERGIIDIRS